MAKPTMLYASPFPPKKSGISDYSVALVKALSKIYDITLYSDNYIIEEESLNVFPVLRHGYDDIDFDSFDYRIYNIGNHPGFHGYIYEAAIKHPGMVILHDYMLYFLFTGYYQKQNDLYSKLYSANDINSFLTVKRAVKKNGPDLLNQTELTFSLSLNKELLSSGNKIMVHSEYARNKVLSTGFIAEDKVRKINLLAHIDTSSDYYISKEELYSKYNIPTDAFVISSLGYIAPTKLNREICEAVKNISNDSSKKLCYVMAGDGDYVDDELEFGRIIKTGYADEKEFNSFIKYSDLIVNLRYPSVGETSGAMIRILQLGKACIINNIGWFAEIPDECAVKIGTDNLKADIESNIKELSEDEKKRQSLGENAALYIEKEFAPEIIVEKIREFI